MNIISNTLEPVIETWDDPGDYPSGAGGAPLRSYDYVADVSGEIVLELDSEDFTFGMEAIDPELPYGIKVKSWNVAFRGEQTPDGIAMRVVLTVLDFDGGEVDQLVPNYMEEK